MRASQKIVRELLRKDALSSNLCRGSYAQARSVRTAASGLRALTSTRAKLSLGTEPVRPSIPAVPPSLVDPAVRPQRGLVSLNTFDGPVKLPSDGKLRYEPDPADAKLHGVRTPVLSGPAKTPAELEVVRQEFIDYFEATYTQFEKMHELFSESHAFFEKHEKLRHPPIFYVGHTCGFYINKFVLGKFSSVRIDPVLEMQMAVGVDEMSWDDLDTNKYVWPSGEEARADPEAATAFLQKCMDFRHNVRENVRNLMRTQPMEWPIARDSFWYVLLMGIEHDRIHLETSSCAFRQAPLSVMQPSSVFPQCNQGRFSPDPDSSVARGTPTNSIIRIPEGTTRLGRSWEGTPTYGWDNEFGKSVHKAVPAFGASEYLCSNREFYDFVQADGYKTERYWTKEGWGWVSDMKPTQPRWWKSDGDSYYLRNLAEEVAMPWDWPVECNHHEGAAYCAYLSERTGRKLRLPSEEECMRLRDFEPTDLQASLHGPRWETAPGNVNLEHFASACPVDMFRSPAGVCDVLGNVWQHCLTPINVLEGFQSHPLYDDFSAPTVDGLHARIMGGSFISTGANGGTRDSRYGFRRHFYQHAGFRYIESDRPVVVDVVPYEVDRKLCNAYRFHFDTPDFGENYPEKLARIVAETWQSLQAAPLSAAKALELGCGPGRTAVELSRGVASMHAADLTARKFEKTSQQLLGQAGMMRWTNYKEGELSDRRELVASELGAADVSKMEWHQMPDFAVIDHKKFRDYDLVVCAQPGALCASDPVKLLQSVHHLVRPDGLLVLGTQYEWPASVAAADASGEEVLAQLLEPWFEKAGAPMDLSFAMAETARKFECGVQHLSFWRRRAAQKESASSGVVADARPEGTAGQAMYDDEGVLGFYLDFHFGPGSDYPVACAKHCVDAMRTLGAPMGRALEIGCGPGRAAIELSRSFAHVDAGDYSQSFVEVAKKFIKDGELRWTVPVDRTGSTVAERSVTPADFGAGSVAFQQMDAHNLPASLTGYDLVCGFNLIDRLGKPRDFLANIRERLNPGGVLVLSSPYTWLEEFTSKDEWLGGFKYGDNDGPASYLGLKEFLEANGFEEAKAPQDVWMRIDELDNGRKSQQTCAQMTFWRRA